MKKALLFLSILVVMFASCSRIMDIEDELDEQSARIAALEQLCSQFNTNIASLNVIVEALANKDYVKSVTPIMSEGVVVGYTITFGQSIPVTIYNGSSGSTAPVIGMKEDGDKWYWTLNGEWLTTDSGKKISVEEATPSLKIEDGKWYVSTDGGKNWKETGTKANAPMFKDVSIVDDMVYLTLYDGTVISLPINISDYFNLPSSMLQLTDKIGEVYKNDTIIIKVRVNPSNYELVKDNLDILVNHDLYTCYTKDSISQAPIFDESVQSTFKVVDMTKDTEGSGIYDIAVAVSGNGNYYDNAQLYLLVKAKDYKGNERSVCSSTRSELTVAPCVSEGIHIQPFVQGIYYIDENDLHESVYNTYHYNDEFKVDKKQKPYVLGLFSNYYVNKTGKKIVFDRSAVEISGLSSQLNADLDTACFSSLGYAKIIPNLESEFWQEKLSQNSVILKDQYITLKKTSGNRIFKESISFDFNTFIPCISSRIDTLSIEEYNLEDYSSYVSFDYLQFFKSTGINELNKSSFSFSKEEITADEKCMHDLVYSSDKCTLTVFFSMYRPQAGTRAYSTDIITYKIDQGQSLSGSMVDIPITELNNFRLISPVICHFYDLVE